jgi:hypothetical protein
MDAMDSMVSQFRLAFFLDGQCAQSLVILEWNKESLAELELLELS